MKALFLSLCVALPMICGGPQLHAHRAPAVDFEEVEEGDNLWALEENEDGLGIEDEVPFSKGTQVYPMVYQELTEVFHGPRLQVLVDGTIPLEDAVHVRLFDQSVWQVAPEDQAKVSRWKPGHVLTVQPNRSWTYSKEERKRFPYVLHNLNTDTDVVVRLRISCDASMHTMPVIKRLYVAEQRIVLDHGTQWVVPVASEFNKLLETWEEGDKIIIGANDSWFGPSNFLINASKKDFCSAQWLR